MMNRVTPWLRKPPLEAQQLPQQFSHKILEILPSSYDPAGKFHIYSSLPVPDFLAKRIFLPSLIGEFSNLPWVSGRFSEVLLCLGGACCLAKWKNHRCPKFPVGGWWIWGPWNNPHFEQQVSWWGRWYTSHQPKAIFTKRTLLVSTFFCSWSPLRYDLVGGLEHFLFFHI